MIDFLDIRRELKTLEVEVKEKEQDLKNLTDGLVRFNEMIKDKQEFTQTEMRNLMRKCSGVFYNAKWSDGTLIISGTFCDRRIKPSRIETRIVAKGSFYYNPSDGRSVYSDTSIENRYFYNINDLKVELERRVKNTQANFECAKKCAFGVMKELQKYFSKNGSPDGKEIK